ncbi:MAG TPA: methyltransferase domain-containing protein [Dongiaceae bacterium]|jgi:ubiquinone/menaquinone biosynthesis C-methylase UbiE|nr:methyltransferase domain-containing protein [Dongiaceae bacterium]
MAERAHPDDPCFQDEWSFRLRRGIVPWLSFKKNPYKAAFHWRYRWASKYCGNKDVLDVPCGMGWGTSLIKGAKSLTGVDLSSEAVAEAGRRYGKLAEFRKGDMGNLGFPDASFDVVVCLEGIEHIPIEVGRNFLMESQRVLRPGGRLLLSSPYCRTKPHSGNPFHIHEYSPDEIRQVVSEWFAIEDVATRDVHIMTVLYLCCRKL